MQARTAQRPTRSNFGVSDAPDCRASVCIVTAGHLSTCPRMLKAADALHEAGYQVRVVSTRFMDWAWQADATVRERRTWDWQVVSYDRESSPAAWLLSGLRFKAAQTFARLAGPDRYPLGFAASAYSRIHTYLVRAILAEPADLIYGGTTGALASAAFAARRAGVPYALDLEDFHSGQEAGAPGAGVANGLAARIERDVLPDAAFLTAGSSAIADAYENTYGVHPVAINNTFPLPDRSPDCTATDGPLRLYWFSQTIGPGRGIEDAVRAMGLGRIPGELHLRGQASGDYLTRLRKLAGEAAPQLTVVYHSPISPDSMMDACRAYDVGLAVEPGFSTNNELALSNKLFTYLPAGLAVAVTDTPGQRPVALDLGAGAILYRPGDIQQLAAGLRAWHDDRQLLANAKRIAWERAVARWHWDHPLERGALLECVSQALAKRR